MQVLFESRDPQGAQFREQAVQRVRLRKGRDPKQARVRALRYEP